MSNIRSIEDVALFNKTVLMREDFNVPMQSGKITDTSRISRAIPSIQALLKAGSAVILCSHLGRPTEGGCNSEFSLAPVAEELGRQLGQEVPLITDWLGGVDASPGDVVLCENVRFNQGEMDNDPKLAKKMGAICDVFVNDAFATAHRAQASTVGVAQYAPQAVAGPLMQQELQALASALGKPKRPLVAIVGGAKVSTKIQLLESLLPKVQVLLVGGGIANTFLKAQGHEIGASLYEETFVPLASSILRQAADLGVEIPLPVDVRVATAFSSDAQACERKVDEIKPNEMILDVGSQTRASYNQLMQSAGTIIFNGPVGVFEFPQFALGTRALVEAIATSSGFSIAGGGDTLAALALFGVSDEISYVSTGGGAFLSYLQGETLPAIAVIQEKSETLC